jgi:trigger factor
VKTKVEELPESRVRLDIEVPEADLQHAFEHAASDLAASLRLPGFRKGKAPLPVVVARVGREAIWQEALKSHLDAWFWSAAEDSGIRPVASPEVEFDGLPEEDAASFKFSATVAVMPKPQLADWTELEVPSAEAEVPPELVDQELERVRETVAELAPVEGRPVQEGDTVVIDITGENLPAQKDYVVEVGIERLVPELDQALVGMAPAETKTVQLGSDEQPQAVELTVKEIKERVLPELDDELAKAASEFDTFAELRAEIEERLREQLDDELSVRFREAAIDTLVDASEVETVEPLVERRTAELWVNIARSLERRGISPETYLTMTGQSADDIIGSLRGEADRSLKRELVLDAVASKLELEVTDEEIDQLISEESAEDDEPEEAKRLLQERGGYERLRADLRLKKALDEVAASVKRIPVELAQAREKLWTPEKEKGSKGMNIWTPSSEEAK